MKKKYYDKSGVEITAKKWADDLSVNSTQVGLDYVEVGGEDIQIYSRYSGIDHGEGKCWELGVDGNPKNAAHKPYHKHHELFKTQAECIAAHNRVKKNAESGKTLTAAVVGI